MISVATIVFPGRWLTLLQQLRVSTGLRLLAFASRVLLGVLLIYVAESTAYATALKVIGVVVIILGVATLLVGNEGLQALVDWFARKGAVFVRAAGTFGLLLGLFLAYALV